MISVLAVLVLGVLFSQYWFREVFFKRPMGQLSPSKNHISSPVDGTLVYSRMVPQGGIYAEKLGEKHYSGEVEYDALHVGIYMSIFDRHHVMAPCDCKLIGVTKWSAGVNLPMLDLHEYVRVMFFRRFESWFSRHLGGWLTQNERVTLSFEDSVGNPFKMILIGDKYVNKIDLEVSPGDDLTSGQKIAFISRGSQTDLVLSLNMFEGEILPVTGNRITAGSTLLLKR